AYIPTNVISITDGQIYLEPNLFNAGVRPALNVGISVSRVGGNAQTKAMKSVAGRLRTDQSQFKALEAFAMLGTELDPITQAQLDRGYRTMEMLKQDESQPYSTEDQVIAIFAVTRGLMDKVPVDQCRRFEKELLKYMSESHAEFGKGIREKKVIENEKELEAVIKEFVDAFLNNRSADVRAQKSA
ncbi:MAG: F0F1 ATP synthase subunit alpha, partial [Spirochaetae bacterium HGW-Spirochaetae-10]